VVVGPVLSVVTVSLQGGVMVEPEFLRLYRVLLLREPEAVAVHHSSQARTVLVVLAAVVLVESDRVEPLGFLEQLTLVVVVGPVMIQLLLGLAVLALCLSNIQAV